jgi:(1->4)-alpha-D-glucan 1-alpha-D-glucosylmutase
MPEALRTTVAAIVPWLCGDDGASGAQASLRRVARRRVEQFATALNAKAVEDTAYYRYGLLLSRNEIGSTPDAAHFAWDTPDFHVACRARGLRHPRALLTTATHDHKRGEDVRARLAVLSERPRWWIAQVQHFEALAGDCGLDALYGGDRWMLWQTLVATWSPTLRPDDGKALRDYAARIVQWQRKALREAKLFTRWIDPAADFEQAAQTGVERLLCSPAGAALRRALWQAADTIGPAGACNGLVQVALRLSVPGVPDLYQGCEGWDLSLVDPDNRRAVDYPQRHAWLRDTCVWDALRRDWRDGAVKARLSARLLQLRRDHPELFSKGDYQPLSVPYIAGLQVLAFQRRYRGQKLVVAIARPTGAGSAIDTALSVPARRWGRAAMVLPVGRYRGVLGENELTVPDDGAVAASKVFAYGPVAVLLSI